MILEFVRAQSISQAQELHKQGYVFLAGGTQVNNDPFRKWGKPVSKVVSLDGLGLGGISKTQGDVIIGAMTPLQDVADSDAVPAVVRQAAAFIPTRSVRNVATIGGNIGANRRDSYIIPALLALGAVLKTAGSDTISLEQYVFGTQGDLITQIVIPPVKGVCVAVKESRSHVSLPVVSAAVRLVAEGNAVTQAAIYAGCLDSHVIKLDQAEKAAINGDRAKVEEAVKKSIRPEADILGSAEYKTYINSVKIADAVELCRREALS